MTTNYTRIASVTIFNYSAVMIDSVEESELEPIEIPDKCFKARIRFGFLKTVLYERR